MLMNDQMNKRMTVDAAKVTTKKQRNFLSAFMTLWGTQKLHEKNTVTHLSFGQLKVVHYFNKKSP